MGFFFFLSFSGFVQFVAVVVEAVVEDAGEGSEFAIFESIDTEVE